MDDRPEDTTPEVTTEEQTPQTQQEERKPLFTVGDRQYDAESAVTKIKSADSFIDTLKTESKQKDQTISDLQAKLDQATKLEEALAHLKQQGQSPEIKDMSSTTDTTPAVDMEALIAELSKKAQEAATSSVQSYKQQEIAQGNQKVSIDAAKSRYGAEYESKLREMGESLGLNDDAIDSMAKSNPALFKQTFGLNAKANSSLYPDGSQNQGASLKDPELKSVNKHWGTSSKVNAQLHNESELMKMAKEANGDYRAVAMKLGVDIKNFAN